MDMKEDISSTGPTTAAGTLNDPSGSEVAQNRQEDLTTENVKSYFKPWRVFINHIDSYHGKLLTNVLSDTAYVDPRSAREGDSPNEKDEFVDDDNEYMEEEEREKRKQPVETTEISRKYEVIGTVLDRKYPCPEDVMVITRNSDDKDFLLSELMTCGIIIYDITQEPNQIEEARWVLKEIVRALEDTREKSPRAFKRGPKRYFILISTIMTWAFTKPLDPADPDLPFTEADYRKRRPHPNYKEHIRCEREVVTVKKLANLKDNLRTLVICCGITYGEEEGPLHYLFKMAWQNAPFLPIFGEGRNRIPLLHIRDLVATVSSVLENWPPIRYIVAANQELIPQNTIVKMRKICKSKEQNEIRDARRSGKNYIRFNEIIHNYETVIAVRFFCTKLISQELTTGEVKNITKEEALLLPGISQEIYNQITVDLNIDPVYINSRIHWHFDMPFRDAIGLIIKEYKAARNLLPVKIIVLGPPASGKTRIARYLANHYGIHYVHVKTLISDTIQRLIDDIEVARFGKGKIRDVAGDDDEDKENREEEEEEEVEEEEVEEEAVARIAKLQEQLDEIRVNMARNKGRLDDIILNKLFLNRLKSKDCSNQGYVLDGYPKTLEQARNLFLISEENSAMEEEQFKDEDTAVRNANIALLPELVVVLEASDEFLKERIINRPESEIQNTHYTEEHMLRRMKEYRERNVDDNTPLQLFDEMEIHPLVIPVEADFCPDMFPTAYQCLEKLGKPRNYGPTEEEMEAARKYAEAEIRAAEAVEKIRKERKISERKRQREEKMMEWTNLMEKLKQEEEERLCILAEPLRLYLKKHVLPTLTEALIEVAKLRPEDPIDFLAEYLFKKNPEGKMFEPDYTETMSMLLATIGRQQNDVLPGEGSKADVAIPEERQNELSTADEIERSDARDVCTKIGTMSISEQTSEYQTAEDFRKEQLNFIDDRMIDEFEDEA